MTLPPYTVSATNPLPSGVSARKVVRDLVIDNLIENAALERDDPALLAFSDTGGVLAIDSGQIASNRATRTRVLTVKDSVLDASVGVKPDPSDPTATIAVLVQGHQEVTTESSKGVRHFASSQIDALIWMLGTSEQGRFLECDVATL